MDRDSQGSGASLGSGISASDCGGNESRTQHPLRRALAVRANGSRRDQPVPCGRLLWRSGHLGVLRYLERPNGAISIRVLISRSRNLASMATATPPRAHRIGDRLCAVFRIRPRSSAVYGLGGFIAVRGPRWRSGRLLSGRQCLPTFCSSRAALCAPTLRNVALRDRDSLTSPSQHRRGDNICGSAICVWIRMARSDSHPTGEAQSNHRWRKQLRWARGSCHSGVRPRCSCIGCFGQ